MSNELGRRIRHGLFALLCVSALTAECQPANAGGWSLPLAQVAPAPVVMPSNVKKPSRMYVVEGIVIVLLFGGAIFAVCRSSGRS